MKISLAQPPLANQGVNFNETSFQVSFDNESYFLTDFYRDLIQKFVEKNRGKGFIVVGHSHGPSSLGSSNLAVKRAEVVARYISSIEEVDAENVIKFASWSGEKNRRALNRGVHIYIFNASK